jgi:DNA repair protein RecN (Recombination protein N)
VLRHLLIRNLAIIDTLELAFDAGFGVLTGETGAGKSILIDALGLVGGSRADASLVRTGTDKAEVVAEFSLEDCPAAVAWLVGRELQGEDESCTLRRLVFAEGRTRAFVNGTPVSAAELRELGETLIEIVGQGDSQSLMRPDVQRDRLDAWARADAVVSAVAATCAEFRRLDAEIETLHKRESTDPARLDYLRFQLQELDALALGNDELENLEIEHRRLANAGRLIADGGRAQDLLYGGEPNAYDLLTSAVSTLRTLAPLAPEFGEVEALAETAQLQAREAADALRRLIERLDLDPERLTGLEARLAAIHDVARKHRLRPVELPARRDALAAEISMADMAGAALLALNDQRDAALQRYREAAADLTAVRQTAALTLTTVATERIRVLGMPDARLVVVVEPISRGPSPHGDDAVRFEFSANPGQSLRPLAKVASGGELSRISLALHVVLRSEGHSGDDHAGTGAGTMIFDEVDAGIGGTAAEIVGRQLRLLGDRQQVLCVTHLPQVAAQGQLHFGIRKDLRDGQTFTRVETLDAGGRASELSRMLGGSADTPATRALAEDLLDRALR